MSSKIVIISSQEKFICGIKNQFQFSLGLVNVNVIPRRFVIDSDVRGLDAILNKARITFVYIRMVMYLKAFLIIFE